VLLKHCSPPQILAMPTTPSIPRFPFVEHVMERLIHHFFTCQSKFRIKRDEDPNANYGGHHSTLNFPVDSENSHSKVKSEWLKDPNTLPNGSGSFGLVKDKESKNDNSWGQPPASQSAAQNEFLNDFVKYIAAAGRHLFSGKNKVPKYRLLNLRMNIVKGASTISHTDVLRCCLTPNYFMFFTPPGASFALKVRNWPRFKTTFVIYKGRMCIPFEFKDSNGIHFNYKEGQGGFLKLIVFDSATHKLKWLICPPTHIDLLQPAFKFPKDIAVAGIKSSVGLYVLYRKPFKVYKSWDEVPWVQWQNLLSQSELLTDCCPPLSLCLSFRASKALPIQWMGTMS